MFLVYLVIGALQMFFDDDDDDDFASISAKYPWVKREAEDQEGWRAINRKGNAIKLLHSRILNESY